MQTQNGTNIERIIAKLDNDFNIDNTDYIPRVAAWVYDALSILKCTPVQTYREKLKVNNRIASTSKSFNVNKLKVFDENGCEIYPLSSTRCACGVDVRDKEDIENNVEETVSITNTLERDETFENNHEENVSFNDEIDDETHALIHKVIRTESIPRREKHYVVISNRQIELDYDAKYITIQYESIKTEYSEMFKCNLPIVPNNGLLIEAVTYYCMYKILCRGVKHPVFNLAASQYGTNPYYMWTSSIEKVKRSVMFDAQGNILEEDGDLWNKALPLFSFN